MTPITEHRTELAHRSSDGIAVSLFWGKSTDRVTIELIDARLDERLEFEVDRSHALDAFQHPYAYAPQPAQARLVATGEAVQR